MTKPKVELDDFLKRHGGVVVCGDTPSGPVYSLADGTKVAVPMDGDDFFFVLPDLAPATFAAWRESTTGASSIGVTC